MALFDHPQIDDSSKRSDESVTALKAHFSQANGFICRDQTPDTGIDFQVELVTEGRNARNWHFSIQLKSISKPELIEDGQIISYSFETSRLGYLLAHVADSGIFVLYNYTSKECFYEFVAEITRKLYDEKGSGWESQNTVNIHVPVANKLNDASLQKIHAHYYNAFKNATRMRDSYGSLYGLTGSGTKYAADDYDLNSPAGIVGFLNKNGMDLLVEYEFGLVSTLVNRLTEAQIATHTQILCLSAIAKSEAGKFDESHIQCRKALKRNDITEDQRILVEYADIKNKFHLGLIDLDNLIQEMEALRQRNLTIQSILTLAVNVTQFILANVRIGSGIPDTYRNSIFDLYDKIEAAPLSARVRVLLMLWNLDNLSLLTNMTLMHGARQAVANGYSGWVQTMLDVIGLNKRLFSKLNAFKKAVPDENGKLLRAYTLHIWVKHILYREIDYLHLKPEINNFAGFPGNLQENINLALTAYTYFVEEGLTHDAYLSLCFALEFIELGRFKLSKDLYPDVPALYEVKSAMEEDMATTYSLRIPEVIRASGAPPPSENEITFTYTDEQLAILQSMISRTTGLPPAQIAHAVDELNAYQEFFRRNKNPDMELHSLYLPTADQPAYGHPVRYYLYNKNSKIQSAPNFNLDALLNDWGL